MQEIDINNYDLSSYSTLEEREQWYLTHITGSGTAATAPALGAGKSEVRVLSTRRTDVH